jgi:hypothetical protein
MGGLRTDAETQTIAIPAAGAAGTGKREKRPGARRRWGALSAYLLAGVLLFVAYLRLSGTSQLNSDSANILLMASDLLHGHLLLHGWYMSDVSFYPTELPQYALLESFLGLNMQTAHVAAAMTYTLVFLLAVMLARGTGRESGSSGRAAWIRTFIAAGIMLAPQFGLGVFALDLSVGHIGTSVPLLLLWLLLDRAPARWYVPVLTALVLAWVLMADQIVYVVGIAPLALTCAVRVLAGARADEGRWRARITARWYDLSLGAAAVAAAGLAWAANLLIRESGGFVMNSLPFYFVNPGNLHNNAPAAWKVLQIFGADYAGLGGFQLVLAFLHLASVLLVMLAMLLVARRFLREVSLVNQVLTVAIAANVALFLLTNAADLAAHEVAVIVPFGAALAARVLIPAVTAKTKKTIRTNGPGARRLQLAALVAGGAVLAGYTAGFGYDLAQPNVPAANVSLASVLEEHHLTYGLSGYWTSSSVTVDSGQRVKVRALMQYTLQPDLWMSKPGWYDPKLHYANFVVLDSQPGGFSHWEPTWLVRKYLGRPAHTYHVGPYAIMVWHRNLLKNLPARVPAGIAPGQFSADQLGGLRPVHA